ncbi:hypothetical protein TPY_2738 [Sulfobacillus acidophilus TPY]|uniref:YHS domain-containing protein n=1 Tax=Sulfobacillus acidophilus (strain ATCC 700253 / DSM 10332 / NAL) TaxID=679936 RepID=G8TUJ6_SULAD|nr:hypothetical protein TPY_2738 [Sulfobacillus acidophilus TPY]AEW04643.1 hypothetical protein Sulac_1143 [Sulfobacillus acidophilus DSM 10332]
MFCDGCGRAILKAPLKETGLANAYVNRAISYYFCSEGCRENFLASPWAFARCEQCQRWIAQHDPTVDLREIRSAQFVDSGVCRRCAGIGLDQAIPRVGS